MSSMIRGVPDGSDITLLDTFYRYPKRQEDGKYSEDYMCLLYKDNITGKKYHEIIEQPTYDYYIAKDKINLDHNLLFIEKQNVDKVTVPYNKLLYSIAENTGNLDFYNANVKAGNRRGNNELHSLYNVFSSDCNIDDFYRFKFSKHYKNETGPVSKAYFDIEADTINMKGDFPEMGECPINAISYIYGNKITSFLLEDPNNPLIEEFKNSINDELFAELKAFIIDNVGGMKEAKKYGLDKVEVDFLFYDEEIRLIQDLFRLVNQNEPDFLLAWNMAFDIPYIVERLYNLGYDPRDIMCHPSFDQEHRVAEYFIDNDHYNEPEARGDRYTISAHTVYLDQLIHFASRRKGQKAFPNFKLDTAGSIIAGVRKLDYSHITTDIAKLPYLDYKTFVFYNIMDTVVQKCIEDNVNDIDYVFSKCNINNTRYAKCHRQTVYLVNRAKKVFDSENFVIGNNINKNNPDVKFQGALVNDPTHNTGYSMIKDQNGQILLCANNLVDFDFKSLYPSDARQHNMGSNTQIGKIIIDEPVHELENPFKNEFYDRGGQFIEDFTSANYITFCHRWFKYADFKEWISDMTEYFTEVEMMKSTQAYQNAFIHFGKAATMNAFINVAEEEQRAFTIYPEEIDYKGYLNKINNL